MPEIFFNGPAGRIEGRLVESAVENAPVALVLHPHPLHGGTMNNKVVYSLYKTLFENDFTVLRINFRGVGRSIGTFDDGIGEMMDAATALDWLQVNYPNSQSCLVAGFSFGAWITMQLMMRRPEIKHFITVSPPVNKYDFSFVSPCPIPGLIIQGNNDSVVSEKNVSEFADKLSKHKGIEVAYKMMSGADHFFRDKIDDLGDEVNDYLREVFSHQEEKSKTKKRGRKPAKKSVKKKVYLD